VARNTRAGRTFESAARTTGQAFKRKEQASSTQPATRSTKKVRKSKSPAPKNVSSNKTAGQKKTASKNGRKAAGKRQGSLF